MKPGRLVHRAVVLCVISSAGAAAHETVPGEPTVIWKHHISSRLAASPLIRDDVLWIPLVKGGLEARSTEDGTKLFQLKTRNEVLLVPLSGDSLCAVRIGEDGGMWLLSNTPPRLIKEIEIPARLLDLDAYGSRLAVLVSGPAMGMVGTGTPRPLTPLQLTGRGWSDIDILGDSDESFHVLVGRREGTIVRVSTSGTVLTTFRLSGGIQYLYRDNDIVLFGRDGSVVRTGLDLKPLWMRDLSSSLQTDPVFRDGEAWIPLRNRTMIRLSTRSGDIINRYELPGPLACPPVVVGDKIGYSSNDGIVSFIDPEDPVRSMQLNTGDPIAGMAAFDRSLYVATERGDLICYRLN